MSEEEQVSEVEEQEQEQPEVVGEETPVEEGKNINNSKAGKKNAKKKVMKEDSDEDSALRNILKRA